MISTPLLRVFGFAFKARRRCPHCGSRNLRPSQNPAFGFSRHFGLAYYRCRTCRDGHLRLLAEANRRNRRARGH
jgi:hypothetical protein